MATSVRRDLCPKASVQRSGSKRPASSEHQPCKQPASLRAVNWHGTAKALKLFGPSVAPVVLFVFAARMVSGGLTDLSGRPSLQPCIVVQRSEAGECASTNLSRGAAVGRGRFSTQITDPSATLWMLWVFATNRPYVRHRAHV